MSDYYREICAALAKSVYGDNTAEGGENNEQYIPNDWEQIKDIPGLNADGYRTALGGALAQLVGAVAEGNTKAA